MTEKARKRVTCLFGEKSTHVKYFDLVLEKFPTRPFRFSFEEAFSWSTRLEAEVVRALLWHSSPASGLLELGFTYEDEDGNIQDVDLRKSYNSFKLRAGLIHLEDGTEVLYDESKMFFFFKEGPRFPAQK